MVQQRLLIVHILSTCQLNALPIAYKMMLASNLFFVLHCHTVVHTGVIKMHVGAADVDFRGLLHNIPIIAGMTKSNLAAALVPQPDRTGRTERRDVDSEDGVVVPSEVSPLVPRLSSPGDGQGTPAGDDGDGVLPIEGMAAADDDDSVKPSLLSLQRSGAIRRQPSMVNSVADSAMGWRGSLRRMLTLSPSPSATIRLSLSSVASSLWRSPKAAAEAALAASAPGFLYKGTSKRPRSPFQLDSGNGPRGDIHSSSHFWFLLLSMLKPAYTSCLLLAMRLYVYIVVTLTGRPPASDSPIGGTTTLLPPHLIQPYKEDACRLAAEAAALASEDGGLGGSSSSDLLRIEDGGHLPVLAVKPTPPVGILHFKVNSTLLTLPDVFYFVIFKCGPHWIRSRSKRLEGPYAQCAE